MYLLKSKDGTKENFVLYKNKVKNQLDKKIKVLRSDRGGEYESPIFYFCSQHGLYMKESHSKGNDEHKVDKFWSTTKHVRRSHFIC